VIVTRADRLAVGASAVHSPPYTPFLPGDVLAASVVAAREERAARDLDPLDSGRRVEQAERVPGGVGDGAGKVSADDDLGARDA
jgi:hypothetical protein